MLCPWVPDVLRLVGVSAPEVNAAVGVRGEGDRVLCRIPVLVGKMPGVNGGAEKVETNICVKSKGYICLYILSVCLSVCLFVLSIGSDISIKSLKRKTQHQRRLQFNQRVKRAF
jgi:hypothetical protein